MLYLREKYVIIYLVLNLRGIKTVALDSGKKGFSFKSLFDFNRDGPGISKNSSDLGTGLKRFFETFKNNFDKIMYCNIFYLLGNFPVFFFIIAWSGITQQSSSMPLYDLFQNLNILFNNENPSAFMMALYGALGMQNQILVPSTLTYVFYGISALGLFTFGLVNIGNAYILRNIAMGEPVFTWSDFWYAIKRNWKQALPFGIFDVLIHAILISNIYNMINSTSGWFESTMLWMNVAIFIAYFFMRFYIYVQMVTFKLSVFKILKNSLIFVLLGIKRNLVAFLGIAIGLVIEVICLFGLGGILVPVAVLLPLLILFSGFAYMKVFAAYYKIKEVMIDPYKAEHPDPVDEYESEDDEVIMTDDVTERERLEAIKRARGIIDDDDE